MEIPLYGRFTDSKNRLFVVINRWKNPLTDEKTNITLLNVHEEKTEDISHTTMQEFITKQQLKQIV